MENQTDKQREPQKRKKYKLRKGRVAVCLVIAVALVIGIMNFFAFLIGLLFGGGNVQTANVSVSQNSDSEADLSDDRHVIVLDSGHSYDNPGAQGFVSEERITPIITEYLKDLLMNDENYKTVLTHNYDIDTSLEHRRDVAIENEADFFISIHCNSFSEEFDVSGFEVYPQVPENPNWDTSYAMAELVAEGFIDRGHTPREDSGIFYCRYETDADGNTVQYALTEEDEKNFGYTGETFGVIKSELYAGILIEVGYVTSHEDVMNWMSDEGCKTVAEIIYEAICEGFDTKPVEY